MTRFQKRLWIGIAVMAALTPIGIILPGKLGAGGAWGEWGTDTLKEMLGYLPRGLERLSRLWRPLLPGYGFGEDASPALQYAAYIISGLIGIALAWLVFYAIKKFLLRHPKNER